ncbi:hypothetical protein K488DRAFT_74776 [Vararia minispora EC-137]|uniref:Uncharacterized protein n=1 Tax=Vararia minispora EC-137 TaxID=1314806 RepID=A0ACB8Q6W4_9AGAM|nr:hypothetical protein K488DRAFT_74776 [Vararia minispora EC-137]
MHLKPRSSRPPQTAAATETLSCTIYALSPELLAQIFFLCRDAVHPPARRPTGLADSALSWVLVSHVCARWRLIVFEWAGLWSHISLSPASPIPRPWVRELFARSRSAPLFVSIALPPFGSDAAWLAELLATHTYHIEHLELAGAPVALHAILKTLVDPAPTLRTLHIAPTHFITGGVPLVIPPSLFANVTPRLRTLSLKCAVLPPSCALLRTLRALSVEFPAQRCSRPPRAFLRANAETLSDVLEGMSELKTLCLAHCCSGAEVCALQARREREDGGGMMIKHVTAKSRKEGETDGTGGEDLQDEVGL